MGLEFDNCDQVLNNIFAKYNGDQNSYLNSTLEIPEFVPNLTLTIEDILFKSKEIPTNHHFGSNILKPEEYLKIVDLVNAKNYDNL